MHAKILKALKGSVKKWEGIVAGTGVDAAERNCPLCQVCRFSSGVTDVGCAGCPVGIDTGSKYCQDTPYIDWCDHQTGVHEVSVRFHVICPECKRIAQRELRYLRRLLKEATNGRRNRASKSKEKG